MVSGNCKKVGVLGAFSGAGPSDFYILSQGVTINHRSYFEVLGNHLKSSIKQTRKRFLAKSVTFIQDGARYYWHQYVKKMAFGSQYWDHYLANKITKSKSRWEHLELYKKLEYFSCQYDFYFIKG